MSDPVQGRIWTSSDSGMGEAGYALHASPFYIPGTNHCAIFMQICYLKVEAWAEISIIRA